MDMAAFAVNGMFTTPKLGNNFTSRVSCERRATPAGVTMAVDAFQRRRQTFGKINVDYSRPKKLAAYKRGGFDAAGLDYPNMPSMAGKYPISYCDKVSGAAKIMRKYDEYCAKGMVQVYKRSAVPYGYYTTACAEGTVGGMAQDKRVFNRTLAFKQAQKPINVRLNELYETRRAAFVMANGCHREEQQFSSMPMSAATYMAAKAEAMGTCYRQVTPNSVAEDYISSGIRLQLNAKANKSGVYALGYCAEGFAKGDAEMLRVASLASEFRALQMSPSAVTRAQYESSRTAVKLYAKGCNHEEGQLYKWPACAAAFCRY